MKSQEESTGTAVKLLTIADVAKAMQLHEQTIYAWIRSGKMPALNIGSNERPTLRIRQTDLDNFMNSHIKHCSNGEKADG